LLLLAAGSLAGCWLAVAWLADSLVGLLPAGWLAGWLAAGRLAFAKRLDFALAFSWFRWAGLALALRAARTTARLQLDFVKDVRRSFKLKSLAKKSGFEEIAGDI
jgi:hypothetical protein